MPDNSIDPMEVFDGAPQGAYGGSAGPVGTTQPQGGGGPSVSAGLTAPDEYGIRRQSRNRFLGWPGMGSPVMGPSPNGMMGMGMGGVRPEMVAMMAQMFRQAMGQGMPHFAQGGIVTQPTVGLLGEAGPEAVVPLGPGSNLYGQALQGLKQQGVPQAGAGSARARAYGFLNSYGNVAGPDPGITAMLRQQAIQDAQAQARSARLGLMGQTTVDPSTYGYQSLMSDLQGQKQVADSVNQAQLQQSLAFQQFIRSLLEQQNQSEWSAYMNAQNQPGVFGSLPGVGSVVGALRK